MDINGGRSFSFAGVCSQVCSPKEMSIAFLEQMELLDDAGVVFKMLQPLCRGRYILYNA